MGSPEAPNKHAQTMRDTRRVLQVLLPGLPPPAIEMACNTFFASSTLQQQDRRSPAGGFKLRRMDSGDFGQLSLTSPPSKSNSKHFGDLKQLSFDCKSPELKKGKR